MANTDFEAGTPAEYEDIRAQVKAIREAEKITWEQLARLTGEPAGTLSTWVGGTYTAPGHKIAAALKKWLQGREARQAIGPIAAMPDYYETPTSRAIWDALTFAHRMPDISPIVGNPGIGKTSTLREYARKFPQVHIITVTPAQGRPQHVLPQLCDALGVAERMNARLFDALLKRLRGTDALLVIDEAQFLTVEALEQMRTLHDQAGIGVALAGNTELLAILRGKVGRKSEGVVGAQLTSRVGTRFVGRALKPGDADAMLDALAIADEQVRKIVRSIAAKPGHLRVATKAIRKALLIATTQNKAIDAQLVRWAYESTTDTEAA
jgi:DNA transposition AAA+ family ATPase